MSPPAQYMSFGRVFVYHPVPDLVILATSYRGISQLLH